MDKAGPMGRPYFLYLLSLASNLSCMKYLIFLFSPFLLQAQDTLSYWEEMQQHRDHLNQEFATPEKSPLTEEDLAVFDSLDFYPVDTQYRIVARFIRTPGEKPFEMATSTSRKPVYEKYGEAHFKLKGKSLVLNIYQNHRLRKMKEYKDYLFLPFKDFTNGHGSYGGGRFLDLRIPSGNTIVIDFNKAYNPLCAYNERYSCPIPPEENHLQTAIEAGVKADH